MFKHISLTINPLFNQQSTYESLKEEYYRAISQTGCGHKNQKGVPCKTVEDAFTRLFGSEDSFKNRTNWISAFGGLGGAIKANLNSNLFGTKSILKVFLDKMKDYQTRENLGVQGVIDVCLNKLNK